MSIDDNYTPPPTPVEKPPSIVRRRTWELVIHTPAQGVFEFTARRERIFLDEDGKSVAPPTGEVTEYTFGVKITQEFLAANPELASLIRGISQFVDKVDPGPRAG